MARQLRVNIEDGIYHVFNRGNLRQNIFFDDSDNELFLGLLFSLASKYQIIIFAYCLIPNHFHILLQTVRANISKFMQHLSTNFVQAINKKHLLSGHLLKGRFHSILVDKDNYLLEVSRYIHLNPIKANLCIKAEEYKWSSFRNYLNLNDNNKYQVETDTILGYFHKDKDVARNLYNQFVYEKFDSIREYNLPEAVMRTAYGSKEFAKKILMKADRRVEKKKGRKRRWKDINSKEKGEKIIEKIKKVYAMKERIDIVNSSIKIKGKKISHLTIYLLRENTELSFSEIGELIGGMDKRTVQKAYIRIKEEITKGRENSNSLDLIRKEIERIQC